MNNFELVKISNSQFELVGIIDKHTVADVWSCRQQLQQCNTDIVIDLTKITLSDSAGLALLICLKKEAFKSKNQLSFINIPLQIQHLSELSHLGDILNAGHVL